MTARVLRHGSAAGFAALAAAGLLLLGGQARGQAPATASIVASDNVFQTADGSPPNVTVSAGAGVNFSYPSGSSSHNVNFTGPEPGSCAMLPSAPAGPGWAGTCTFDTPGTYPFICDVHPSTMTGSVTVAAAATAPPPPPPATAPPPPPPAGMLAPASSPAASSPLVKTRQRGSTVRGSVRVRTAGSRLLARAFARRGALVGGRSSSQILVGRSARSVGAGRVAFSVRLASAGRRALRRNGRLSISLRLKVTPPTGASYSATRAVILRAP